MRPLQRVDAREPLLVVAALERALRGDGPAVLPFTPEAGEPGSPARTVPSASEMTPAEVVLVIETSGSTAAPKRVMLSADALRASAAATYRRFDELFPPNLTGAASPSRQWLLALPCSYVAGAQVLVRSMLAGTRPVLLEEGPFTAAAFARAAARLTADLTYVSLVPAQLARLLDEAEGDPSLAVSVAGFAAILIGGQSLQQRLRERADRLGWRVVTSYGASETSGGSVYNGEPLEGVRVRVHDGEVQLAGPVLATGYLGDPARTAAVFVEHDGTRWYRTSDGGRIVDDAGSGRQRLVVTGRLDSVIISGGEKVLLDRVELLVRGVKGLEEAVVVAAPSEAWGQVPAVVVAAASWLPRAEAGSPPRMLALEDLEGDARWSALRAAAAEAGRAARPGALLLVDALPVLASGKPDRRALEALLAQL